ncbi:MAG TPA: protein kinase [Gemmatimonadaceae bacterium]|nr:protein kinase [Gemmatimonadaceae bacterium]
MSETVTRLGPALTNRYRIEREIGAGGMATVYLARDLRHDRDVALKVLRPELAAVLGVDRFLNEIKISARLDHPHILTLIDSGTADGFLYYVMPFVRGESLRDRLNREKQLGVDEALRIIRQVASALEYAHRQGVVHRDIKPENVLIHEGEAMLADFGIAMAVKEAGGSRLTETGLSLGTPQYMSPEQATGDRTLDARSDVYSLAAVLYELLAGEPPHSGATVQAIIAKLMTERPTRLRVIRDTVPQGVDNAVAKALAKVPADRYLDAGEFARALSAVTPADLQSGRSIRRWIPVAAGIGVAVVALAVVTVMSRREMRPMTVLDQVPLTITGNAFFPSISPDGSRIAFSELQCGPDGDCLYRLVIQDADGTGRLVVTDSIPSIGQAIWSDDARYLVYPGSYGSNFWGVFAVSTLGGEPRRIGCCDAAIWRGDTAVLTPAARVTDTLVWAQLVTLRDGQVRDSIRILDPGTLVFATPTDDPGQLVTLVYKAGTRELRLLDRSGSVLDRAAMPSDDAGRPELRWLRGQGVLFGVRSARGGDAIDLVRLRVSDGKFEQRRDTIANSLVLASGFFDVSADGSKLVSDAGPVETTIWGLQARGGIQPSFERRELVSSTTRMYGRISPNGERVAFIRQVMTGGQRQDELLTIPFESGGETRIASALGDVLDFEWRNDGSGFVLAIAKEPERTLVIEIDSTGRRRRELKEVDRAVAIGLQSLRDGGVVLTGADRQQMLVIARPGRRDAVYRFPSWVTRVGSINPSPDRRSVALLGWDANSDSVVIARADLDNGAFEKLATLGAEDRGRVDWLDDGSINFWIRETRGGSGLYRIPAGGKGWERVATLPFPNARYQVSANGKRALASSARDRADVQMIRNLGDRLR